MEIDIIRSAIRLGNVHVSRHANEEAGYDMLTFEEIYHSVLFGEIIEEYPGDRPFPSCLVFGRSNSNQPIHSVWAIKPDGTSVLITVYKPDPEIWTDFQRRRLK